MDTTLEMVPLETADVVNPLQKLILDNVEGKELTLPELIKRYQEIEGALIESGGLAVYGDQLEKVDGQIEKKFDACKGFIDYSKGQVNYLDEKEKTYKNRKTAIKNGIDWLRGSMKAALQLTGKEKIKTTEGTYYFTKARVAVKIDSELLSEKYAHALQVIGVKSHKVVITLPQGYEEYAEQVCLAITGADWEVTEPEFDLDKLATRYVGTNRKWPPYLKPGEKTFTIR
jgi:hypothetical protein